ncbi:hypothetical protein O6H91_05G079700 [Diphasiastrum complanatum]|uniref:Uncharacterized protein n=1 Tax=Diphasiastrum complanatum TaxID=34168 RepID=A0ACC2DQ30_DIPCM|nr:hypothetical protein O6H91_05G079700 [Diphasiastrum complanatum]
MARRLEEEEGEQDDSRVIAYFDVDCFYAQAEVLRRPYLQDRPVGVTQKFLVVTCNYVARRLGVPKMAPIDEAKRRCPDLVLINGEDLTPYRAASKIIMQVLSRFGTLERRGLDEAALDITEEVRKRFSSSINVNTFQGHLVGNVTGNAPDILSSAEASPAESETSGKVEISQSREALENRCLSLAHTASTSAEVLRRQGDFLLMVGSHLVAEMREAVEKETGYRCSSGIAHNKLLAKLACSLNKPNKQTCILPSAADNFLRPLSVRKIPGVGQRMEGTLKEMGIGIVEDMQRVSVQQLCGKFGHRVGQFLYNACRGIDPTPVVDKGHAKSLSVEDSVRNCTSLHQAKDIIQSLAPDLLARLDEDKLETGRRPQAFVVKWRVQGNWMLEHKESVLWCEL